MKMYKVVPSHKFEDLGDAIETLEKYSSRGWKLAFIDTLTNKYIFEKEREKEESFFKRGL
jgi:hypothetical protein